ncbi:glycosyltransferase family 2 protein [candidate division KSB1 bacterium]|nr:glycosyltransferase family 2 protein [candidate division KSB1 bacterium]RQW01905.1 MAG: glycosyltransferase [candidate division KSB1 bacterium]
MQVKKKEKPYLSVVVPFFNEEESIERLWQVLKSSLDEFGQSYEVIFVDDGSMDRTRDIMRRLASDHPELLVILFRANFGQSAAMAAGFEASRGDVVVAIDGDLQNDPRDIRAIVDKLNEGYDVVSGWRKNRQDKMVSRLLPSKIANHIICSVTDVKLHDTGCSLKAFRGDLLRRISLYGELHRFIPALLRMEGARITEMAVRHHARRYGTSKYNLSRTFRVIMDLLTIRLLMQHLQNPLSFFAKFSILAGAAGTVTFFRALAQIVLNRIDVATLNISISMTVLLWAASFMFMSLGLVGKMIVDNGERRPFSLE